jgi:SAM-dependent methyltransferase
LIDSTLRTLRATITISSSVTLSSAGLSDRVRLAAGDIAAMPFPDATFGSAVSTNVMDHLGRHQRRGLSEVYGVLKPGGRFLMVVHVPGWSTFALGSVFSLMFTPSREWRRMARHAGFNLGDGGPINGAWYLMQRPTTAHSRRRDNAASHSGGEMHGLAQVLVQPAQSGKMRGYWSSPTGMGARGAW